LLLQIGPVEALPAVIWTTMEIWIWSLQIVADQRRYSGMTMAAVAHGYH
jgi:hypothetical protein